MRRSGVHFLKSILSAETEDTESANVLFRGNTVATKSVDMYMRLTGITYLKHILKDIIAEIFSSSSKKSCEVPIYVYMCLTL